MAISDLYSKRQKHLRGDAPDVFTYDDIAHPLRVQLVQNLQDGIGSPENDYSEQLYTEIYQMLCREYGVFSLGKRGEINWSRIANTLLQTADTERVIDIVELCLRAIDKRVRNNRDEYRGIFRHTRDPDEVIHEINHRFREHGVGYEYVSGEIIRVDSKLLHKEVVKPALVLLSDEIFQGANEEFLKGHEHYRHGRYKECLNECLKAFESTMKAICDGRGWQYNKGDTAKALINVCLSNGLFPPFMQTQLSNVRTILESGVPTVRNKLGGHGQGASVITVPESLASYMLHLTAANIVLLANAEKGLP